MGEHTSCNYCNIKSLENRAKKEGKIVCTVVNTKSIGRFGPGVDVHLLDYISQKVTAKNFVAWMASIPNRCCC